MIDVKNCRCKHPGCTRQPNYGHEGGRAKYCSSHKLSQMVNVVSRRCDVPDCKRQVGPSARRDTGGHGILLTSSTVGFIYERWIQFRSMVFRRQISTRSTWLICYCTQKRTNSNTPDEGIGYGVWSTVNGQRSFFRNTTVGKKTIDKGVPQ